MADMTQASAPGVLERDPEDWVTTLRTPGPEQDAAIRRLHDLMRRAAARYVNNSAGSDALGHVRREEIIHATADEATMEVLNKLDSFEGRSRFTTWAYKFAILKAAVEVRRSTWRSREIDLDLIAEPLDTGSSPHDHVEGNDLADAVRRSISESLTPHQRRVLVAIVVEGIPIDVLAERLDSNRNALYKTLHDARKRLREDLIGQGLVDASGRKAGDR